VKAHRSRPRRIGVGCPASWPSDAGRGRVFRNGLQILAKVGTFGRERPRTVSTMQHPHDQRAEFRENSSAPP
jgi:hypothetical protein